MTWMIMAQAIAGASAEQVEGYAVRAQTRADNRIREVNATSSNKVRRATNAYAAARGALARYMQSLNNNEALTQAGKAQYVNLRNGLKARDKLAEQGSLADMAYAEQHGRAVAQQGAAGVSGQAVDNVNAATALRAAIIADNVKANEVSVTYDVALKAQTIASQMTRSLDSSIIMDAIDYNTDVAWKKQEYTNTQNAFRGLAKAMGQGANLYTPSQNESPQQTKYSSEYDGVAVRQRSNSPYDLSNQAYDTNTTFGDGGSKRNSFDVYAGGQYDLQYGQTEKVKFNINTTESYGGL